MKVSVRILVLLMSASLLSGCAVLDMQRSRGLKNSALSNLNPAPDSMSPPQVTQGADLTVDPVYMRTKADYHYSLGEALSMEGEVTRAIEEFKTTLIYDPNATVVRLRLAAEYVKGGLLSEAIEHAELAVRADPDSVDARLLLGGLYSTLKVYDLALEHYNFILIQDPDNAEVPVFVGALLAEQQKYEESVQYFERLKKNKRFKKPHLVYYYIGRVRFEQGTEAALKSAEQSFLKAIAMKPGHEDSVMGLAKIYRRQKRMSQVVKLLSSFQDKFGPKRKVAKQLSQLYLELDKFDKAREQLELYEGFDDDDLNIKVKIALIHIEKKEHKKAIRRLTQILKRAPDSDKIRFYLGAVHEEINQKQEAIKNFMMIPTSSSYYPEAVVHASYLHKTLGEFDGAAKVITRGIKMRPDIPQFYTFYASLLDAQKDYNKATKMLTVAVNRFPKDTQLHFFLGSMQDKVGNKKETISQMKKVLEIDQEHVQALNYLAYTYAESGKNLDEAESLVQKALSIKPDDGYILDTMGWVLFKKGNLKTAIKYLEAAYKVKSSESIVAEHLGDAYYRFQLHEKAKRMYKKAVTIETDKEKIRQLNTKIVSIENQQARVPAKQPRAPASQKKTQ